MSKIKKYDEFVNEEINLKKALAGAALGAGLAFGSPSVAHAEKEPIKTEITSTQTIENFSKVVYVDSTLTKEKIQNLIVNQLYSSPTIKITINTPGRIVANINFSSKPKMSYGLATGTMEILFKDGRYKVSFSNIQFDYQGQQPTPPLQSTVKNVEKQLKNTVINSTVSQIRNPILQSAARSVTSQSNKDVYQDKPTMTYEESLSSNPEFASGIDSEISTIMANLNSVFSSDSKDNDW